MDLIQDWKDFCLGKVDFDISHFYTLLHEEDGPVPVEVVFAPFEDSRELEKRYFQYKSPKKKVSDEALINLVKLDIEEKKKICSFLNKNSLGPFFNASTFTFVSKSDFNALLHKDIPHHSICEAIGDHLVFSQKKSKKNDAILEAFYGLTVNNNLVWFLGKPLYNSAFNPDPYFNVWSNSGDYLIGLNEIFVLKK
jgi:hypothetical protein